MEEQLPRDGDLDTSVRAHIREAKERLEHQDGRPAQEQHRLLTQAKLHAEAVTNDEPKKMEGALLACANAVQAREAELAASALDCASRLPVSFKGYLDHSVKMRRSSEAQLAGTVASLTRAREQYGGLNSSLAKEEVGKAERSVELNRGHIEALGEADGEVHAKLEGAMPSLSSVISMLDPASIGAIGDQLRELRDATADDELPASLVPLVAAVGKLARSMPAEPSAPVASPSASSSAASVAASPQTVGTKRSWSSMLAWPFKRE